MGFKFTDDMIHDHRREGYVIFRQVLPTSLVRDLRRAAARIHELARTAAGPQAQRLQPFAPHLNPDELKPFHDYINLAPLVDAIHKLLSPQHKLSNGAPDRMAMLLEPAEHPWCTAWHRDIRETSNVPDAEEFRRLNADPLGFNQINCPLYEDNCTWYVPGSWHRGFDLPGEKAAGANPPQFGPDAGREERERACLEYCQSMPHAIRASMDAGDFMIYQPNGWHLGNYLPDRKRVTIHDWAPSPRIVEWYTRWYKKLEEATEARKKEAATAQPKA